jgi:hypothetical protein
VKHSVTYLSFGCGYAVQFNTEDFGRSHVESAIGNSEYGFLVFQFFKKKQYIIS